MELLKMHIHKIKGIHDMDVSLPLVPGVYAITGENGVYKSTIAACAAMIYKTMPRYEYFGEPESDAYIQYLLGEQHYIARLNRQRRWKIENGDNFAQKVNKLEIGIYVFFEGCLFFGSRFQNISFGRSNLKVQNADGLQEITDSQIVQNLGYILYNDRNRFTKVLIQKNDNQQVSYYYEWEGQIIDDVHMSSGETMMLKTLVAIFKYNQYKPQDKKGIMFIDEVEMGLHPSSIKRLLEVLNEMATSNNYAIYLITHSVPIIRQQEADHILYVHKVPNGGITNYEIINPCAPSQATSMIYEHISYDDIIFVEDIYAKLFIEYILEKENLGRNGGTCIQPIAGWSQVIEKAHSMMENGVLPPKTKAHIVLDGDAKAPNMAPSFIGSHPEYSRIPLNYLPISSIEKFVKEHIVDNLDEHFKQRLQNSFHISKDIIAIKNEYKNERQKEIEAARAIGREASSDNDGKSFCKKILHYIQHLNIYTFICVIVEYLYETESQRMQDFVNVLKAYNI